MKAFKPYKWYFGKMFYCYEIGNPNNRKIFYVEKPQNFGFRLKLQYEAY